MCTDVILTVQVYVSAALATDALDHVHPKYRKQLDENVPAAILNIVAGNAFTCHKFPFQFDRLLTVAKHMDTATKTDTKTFVERLQDAYVDRLQEAVRDESNLNLATLSRAGLSHIHEGQATFESDQSCGIQPGVCKTLGNLNNAIGNVISAGTDDDFRRNRIETRRNTTGDANKETVLSGVKSLGLGVVHGVVGLVAKPVKRVKEGGAGGLLKGVREGVTGLVLKPVVGALDLASGLTASTARTSNMCVGPAKQAIHTIRSARHVSPSAALEHMDQPSLQACSAWARQSCITRADDDWMHGFLDVDPVSVLGADSEGSAQEINEIEPRVTSLTKAAAEAEVKGEAKEALRLYQEAIKRLRLTKLIRDMNRVPVEASNGDAIERKVAEIDTRIKQTRKDIQAQVAAGHQVPTLSKRELKEQAALEREREVMQKRRAADAAASKRQLKEQAALERERGVMQTRRAADATASKRELISATMNDWRLVEESKQFGTLGDAVRSLTQVPAHYLKEDLAKIGASDNFDNTKLCYGPDENGTHYQITHHRKQNWKLRHDCSAEVRVQQPARVANQSLQKSTVKEQAAAAPPCDMIDLLNPPAYVEPPTPEQATAAKPCQACTFENLSSNVTCELCGSSLDVKPIANNTCTNVSETNVPNGCAVQDWNCPACSFENCGAIGFCDMCETPSPKQSRNKSLNPQTGQQRMPQPLPTAACVQHNPNSPASNQSAPSDAIVGLEQEEGWKCSACTFLNPIDRLACEICDTSSTQFILQTMTQTN